MSLLRMEKRDLRDLPEFSVPNGYELRNFEPGDEVALASVYASGALGSSTPEEVVQNIVEAPCFSASRLFVVEHQAQVVATAAAWIEPAEPKSGYLHMLGVLPTHRKRRLGALLTCAAAEYSRGEGFDHQRLITEDWREDAVRLYLQLGYDPLVGSDEELPLWEGLARRMHRPDILERVRLREDREPRLIGRLFSAGVFGRLHAK